MDFWISRDGNPAIASDDSDPRKQGQTNGHSDEARWQQDSRVWQFQIKLRVIGIITDSRLRKDLPPRHGRHGEKNGNREVIHIGNFIVEAATYDTSGLASERHKGNSGPFLRAGIACHQFQ